MTKTLFSMILIPTLTVAALLPIIPITHAFTGTAANQSDNPITPFSKALETPATPITTDQAKESIMATLHQLLDTFHDSAILGPAKNQIITTFRRLLDDPTSLTAMKLPDDTLATTLRRMLNNSNTAGSHFIDNTTSEQTAP